MTDSETLTAINEGFAAEGYDTHDKIKAFVQASVRQMKVIVAEYQAQLLANARSTADTQAQAAVEAKLAEVTSVRGSILGFVETLAQ